MEQILVAESPIDKDIAAVRVQIEALRHRRSLLSHTLLSSRRLKSQIAHSSPNADVPRTAIEFVKEQIANQENTTVTNLHRAFAGITAFRVQDPDPNAIDGGKILGIRIEIFSARDRAFITPYYVLLNQPESDAGLLKIHKHTIPVCIPLQSLVKKYLPYKVSEDNSLKAGPPQDLPKFVRSLRKELVAHHKRIEAYKHLKEELENRRGVSSVKMLDSTAKEIEILFTNNILARIRVELNGRIERVAVGPSPDAGTEEHSAKVYREIKRTIESGDGRIDSLSTRLRWTRNG
ncbi:uncharacterized protein PV09_01872 [Verruconis gallopava]|uniref:Cenp-O kinetochore centromere component n=1 Tax=Verruconis gallopava TaxID=253628 RepID=A0A0D2AMM7_9PEZI|nr:uncharacterized protein PV09_01872 [Verruconis gallopava]KIW07973.1 hypothetical protein PV09_01872 [Verruconis gallopava]